MTTQARTPALRRPSRGNRLHRDRVNPLVYVVAIALSITFLFPLFWMATTSLKTMEQAYVFPPKWIPSPIVWQNYVRLFTELPFLRFTWNSVVIAVLNTIGVTLSSALCAFGFARLRARGRGFLFLILLSTIMLPYQVILVPTFILFKKLNWIDTILPLVVPAYFGGGAFNIFLLRQFFMTIPFELDEAAIIDGAGWFTIFWRILLPLSKPALATVAVLNFVSVWTDFFGPLIYLNSLEKMTLAVGLAFLRGQHYSLLTLMMAGSMYATIPMLVIFFVAQRYFVEGIVLTGLKG